MPNPAQDALKKQIAETENNARSLVAKIVSSSDSPESISQNDYRKAKGRWTGSGYLSDSCGEVVDRIEPIRLYREKGWSLIGQDIVFKNGTHVPLQQTNIRMGQAPVLLDSVTCDERLVYAIKRQSMDQIIVYRISPPGEVLDMSRISLPEVNQFFIEKKWQMIWSIVPDNNTLNITLANYSYTRTADQGGILERRISYSAQLSE